MRSSQAGRALRGRPTDRARRFAHSKRPGSRDSPRALGRCLAARPSETTLASALSTLVSLQGATAQELAKFRLSFEANTAWWAARRADDDDVTRSKHA